MEKKLTVNEIIECINLLTGGQFSEDLKITGFCSEKSISEGTRRIAHKTKKKLLENYPVDQFKEILTLTEVDYPKELSEEDQKRAYLVGEKEKRVLELRNSEVTLNFEELPDWKVMNDRLEETKQNLSFDYTYLFDRLFLNY